MDFIVRCNKRSMIRQQDITVYLQEIVEGVNWIDLAQDNERWGAGLNAVMKLRIPYNTKNFSTS